MTIVSKEHSFKARDNMFIDGLLTTNTDNKNQKLLILLPGITGQPQHYMFLALRDEFIKNGYDIFIANLYGSETVGEKQPRSLLEITMQRHIEDFDDMVGHFSQSYRRVYAAGHSLSGRTVLLANNTKLAKQILIDPAGNYDHPAAQEKLGDYYKVLAGTEHKYLDWEDGIFYPAGSIVNELIEMPFQNIKEAINNLHIETLVVIAKESQTSVAYKDHVTNKLSIVEIPDASHVFWESGVIQNAATEMLKFLNK